MWRVLLVHFWINLSSKRQHSNKVLKLEMPALKLFKGGQFTLSTHFIKLITLLYIHQCSTTVSYPLTPYDHYLCSPYCSLYISSGADMENLFSNQKLLLLLIITFILVTFMLDSGVIFFLGEIRCLSLLGV